MEPFKLSTEFWNQISPGHDDTVSSFVICKDNSPSTKEEHLSTKPPELPRTAFMCFMAHRAQLLQDSKASSSESKDLLQVIAAEWNNLSANEKAEWQEASTNDRTRYSREKKVYAGPSQEPKLRAKKHPLAPKRPPSAFLKFAQVHRSSVKAHNPTLLNTDVSRILGEMWRNASTEVKSVFITQEEQERGMYKQDIAMFRLKMKNQKSHVVDVPKRPAPAMKRAQTEAATGWDRTPVRPRLLHPNVEHGYMGRGSYDSSRMNGYGLYYPKSHNPAVFSDMTPPEYYTNTARRFHRSEDCHTPSIEGRRNSRYFYPHYSTATTDHL